MRVGMARVLVTGLSATMWINLMPSLPFHADTVRVDSAHQRSCAQLRAARNRSALPQFEVPTQPALPLKAYAFGWPLQQCVLRACVQSLFRCMGAFVTHSVDSPNASSEHMIARGAPTLFFYANRSIEPGELITANIGGFVSEKFLKELPQMPTRLPGGLKL